MGSVGSLDSGYDNRTKSWNVLVTGFGPFVDNDINPSFLIAASLPAHHRAPDLPAINIHVHPSPVEVCYKTIRDIIPRLLFPHESKSQDPTANLAENPFPGTETGGRVPDFDIVLHIGLAAGRDFYALETCAHRDGYTKKDVRGETLAHDSLWKDSHRAPDILTPTFDTEDVWRRWKSALVNEDVRPSYDAGHYCCDFIYFTSLVEYWRRDLQGRRPCMFLHVPTGHAEEDLARGRCVALGLIAALLGNLLAEEKGSRGGREAQGRP